MTCADFEILLCEYVDGILDGQRKASVEKHLAECSTCAQLARDVSAAVAFTQLAPPVEPPDELVTRLLYQAPTTGAHRKDTGIRGLVSKWMQPVLQPRFAMGMAMTILSFSLLAKFAGIPERQLSPADLHPAKVWQAVDDRLDRAVDRIVKYYDSLKVVYEIQSRLNEWSDEDEAAAPQAESPVTNDSPGIINPSATGEEGAANPDERSVAR
jgi:hypothetical protein